MVFFFERGREVTAPIDSPRSRLVAEQWFEAPCRPRARASGPKRLQGLWPLFAAQGTRRRFRKTSSKHATDITDNRLKAERQPTRGNSPWAKPFAPSTGEGEPSLPLLTSALKGRSPEGCSPSNLRIPLECEGKR